MKNVSITAIKFYRVLITLTCTLFICSASITHADTTTNESYPDRWKPLYTQCQQKLLMAPALVQIRATDPSTLTEEQIQEFDKIESDMGGLIKNICSCTCTRVNNAFNAAGYDISTLEIALLSQAFRFETLYPDKAVRETFGIAILPCFD